VCIEKKNSLKIIFIETPYIDKLFALKKKLYWKIICIEKLLSLNKLLGLKKMLSLKNYFTYKMLHLKLFSTLNVN
jgi:hypothetical protein